MDVSRTPDDGSRRSCPVRRCVFQGSRQAEGIGIANSTGSLFGTMNLMILWNGSCYLILPVSGEVFDGS